MPDVHCAWCIARARPFAANKIASLRVALRGCCDWCSPGAGKGAVVSTATQWRAASSRSEQVLASLTTSTAAVITNLLALFHPSLRCTDGCGDVRDREPAEGAPCICARDAEAGLLYARALRHRSRQGLSTRRWRCALCSATRACPGRESNPHSLAAEGF